VAVPPTCNVVNGWLVSGMSGSPFFDQRFDQDLFREFRADAEPGMTNLANNIGVAADEADFLVFAKPHLAQAAGNFRRG